LSDQFIFRVISLLALGIIKAKIVIFGSFVTKIAVPVVLGKIENILRISDNIKKNQ